jgi:hypothetical protein
MDPRPPFHVGLIAVPGYDPPQLEQSLPRCLDRVLDRVQHSHRVSFLSEFGQPVSIAVRGYAQARGFQCSGLGSGHAHQHVRAWLQILACSDALVVFGPSRPDIDRVVALANWLGIRVRQIPSPEKPNGIS